MKNVNFSENECVKIENLEQFKEIYHVLRSARVISCDDWLAKYGTPKFPRYLEHANIIGRNSIGFCNEPISTFTRKPYEVLTFEQATLEN
jgi:hypothetical protein